MNSFCPRCGKTGDTVIGPRGLCRSCFVETTTFIDLPEEIRFEQCSSCRRYKTDNTWTDFESDQKLVFDMLRKYEREDIEMAASFQRQGNRYHVAVFMEKTVSGEPIQMKDETVLVPEEQRCHTCSRFESGYFEAVVQLRDNISEQFFGWLMERAGQETTKDRTNFISNVEERHGGYDIYVSSTTMAEKLIKIIKERKPIDKTRTKELVGEKEGKKLYRSIYSIRVQ